MVLGGAVQPPPGLVKEPAEHREHEEALALETPFTTERGEELCRQKDVRLEEARQPIVPGGEPSSAFCNHLLPS